MKIPLISIISVLAFSLTLNAGSFNDYSIKGKKDKPFAENKLDANYEGFVIGTDASPKRLTVKGNLVVGNAGYRKFETVDRKNISYQDLEVGQSGTAKDLMVYGETKLGPNRVVGQINNFDPHANQLLVSFVNGQSGRSPAHVYMTYITTLTWAYDSSNPISVSLNNNFPIIVDPYNPCRSSWKVENNGSTAGTEYQIHDRSGLAEPLLAFNAWSTYSDAASVNVVTSGRLGSIPNALDLLVTATVRKPTNLSYSMAVGFYNSYGTANSASWFTHSTAAVSNYKAMFQGSNGTLFYEVIGQNVLSVSKTVTWDRTITIPALTGSSFLNWFLGLADLDQDVALGQMSNAQLLNLFTTLAAQIVSDRTKDAEVRENLLAKILTARDSKSRANI
jgi:hypothetical protein